MSFILLFSLDKFVNYLDYSYNYKAVYLISIVSFVGMFYLLNSKKILLIKNQLMTNFIKILISAIAMSFILLFYLDKFAYYLDYSYNYKAVYLISIVSFVGMFYLLSCYLLGTLKLKNYKTN